MEKRTHKSRILFFLSNGDVPWKQQQMKQKWNRSIYVFLDGEARPAPG